MLTERPFPYLLERAAQDGQGLSELNNQLYHHLAQFILTPEATEP